MTWTDDTSSGVKHDAAYVGVASSSSGQYLAAVATGGDVYTSNNYGATWVDDTASTPEANGYWESVASSSSGENLVADELRRHIHVY